MCRDEHDMDVMKMVETCEGGLMRISSECHHGIDVVKLVETPEGGLVRISSECHQGMDVMKIVATSEGGLGPPPPLPPLHFPKLRSSCSPQRGPRAATWQFGEGKGGKGGGIEMLAQNAATASFNKGQTHD